MGYPLLRKRGSVAASASGGPSRGTTAPGGEKARGAAAVPAGLSPTATAAPSMRRHSASLASLGPPAALRGRSRSPPPADRGRVDRSPARIGREGAPEQRQHHRRRTRQPHNLPPQRVRPPGGRPAPLARHPRPVPQQRRLALPRQALDPKPIRRGARPGVSWRSGAPPAGGRPRHRSPILPVGGRRLHGDRRPLPAAPSAESGGDRPTLLPPQVRCAAGAGDIRRAPPRWDRPEAAERRPAGDGGGDAATGPCHALAAVARPDPRPFPSHLHRDTPP